MRAAGALDPLPESTPGDPGIDLDPQPLEPVRRTVADPDLATMGTAAPAAGAPATDEQVRAEAEAEVERVLRQRDRFTELALAERLAELRARICPGRPGRRVAAGQAAAWEVLRTLVSPRVRFDVWGGGFRFLPWPGFEHRVPHVGSELRRGAAQQVAADRVQAGHLHVRHRRGRQHLPAAVPHGRPGGHVEREANASTSNPLIFPNWSSTWDTVSGISLAARALEVHGLEGAG